jgi:uncharacterized membrane protein
MNPFSPLDLVALAWFVGAWIAYAVAMEWTHYGTRGLNELMNRYREPWIRRMLERDMRMVDMQIMAALQNGAAFFASTSLLAVGGALALFRSTEEALAVLAMLPLGLETSRVLWDVKVIGLAVILVYAFFKFAWSYRLFAYVAILFGATPHAADRDSPAAEAHVVRTARLFTAAGRHFNRGQRAFFFALAYLGWFLGPWVFMATTAAAVLVMWARQFASDARRALLDT